MDPIDLKSILRLAKALQDAATILQHIDQKGTQRLPSLASQQAELSAFLTAALPDLQDRVWPQMGVVPASPGRTHILIYTFSNIPVVAEWRLVVSPVGVAERRWLIFDQSFMLTCSDLSPVEALLAGYAYCRPLPLDTLAYGVEAQQ